MRSRARASRLATLGVALICTQLFNLSSFAAADLTVDNASIGNEGDGNDWLSYGRTFSEQRFSPLRQINADTVKRLNLAWSLDLNQTASMNATPLESNGVIYAAVGYSVVHAVDAKTGKLLWRYDPHVEQVARHKMHFSWGIRGLALWKDKVLIGTHDGRLLALTAKTGKLIWSVMTVTPEDDYWVSGAPRVFNGKVIIGNSGDVGAPRGYVTAYDVETGKQLWRFFTVPGDPAKGFENDAMKMAAKTWTGEWWKLGGGGGVWNAMTYDPEFNRIYIGVDSGTPWNRRVRSPDGGDNLFLASVVALDADTGRYVWHYQANPGETWDWGSPTDMVLATLTIEQKPTKVILHAPKNGFFYVINRETGQLISAEKIAKVNWADHIDIATGRPVETPNARYDTGEELIWPGSTGAHNWQPMSFSPQTGLVYVPIMNIPSVYSDQGIDAAKFRPIPHTVSSGLTGIYADSSSPDDGSSYLVAWDPIRQKAAWRVATPGVYDGGTLATAGNLVFQGHVDGKFVAYSADTGKVLWSYAAGNGISAPPITYQVGNTQYVSILTGIGGGASSMGELTAQWGWQAHVHPRRLLTFMIDGTAKLPPTPPPAKVVPLDDPKFVVNADKVNRGRELYLTHCAICHGIGAVGGGQAPDLRASPFPMDQHAFGTIVRVGTPGLPAMPRFPELSDDDIGALQHYVRDRAREGLKTTQKAH